MAQTTPPAQTVKKEPEGVLNVRNIVQPQINLAEQNARTSFNEALRALSSTKDAGFQEFLRGSKIAGFVNDPNTFKRAEVSFRSTSAQDGAVSISNIDVTFRPKSSDREVTLHLSVVHNTTSPNYSQMSISLFQPPQPTLSGTEKPKIDLEIISRSQTGLHYHGFAPHSVPRRVE